MRKTRRQIKRKRRFFPGSNVAIDEIEVTELEDWMASGSK
jgi:hypothetical protein